jgi:hypothetical protein
MVPAAYQSKVSYHLNANDSGLGKAGSGMLGNGFGKLTPIPPWLCATVSLVGK